MSGFGAYLGNPTVEINIGGAGIDSTNPMPVDLVGGNISVGSIIGASVVTVSGFAPTNAASGQATLAADTVGGTQTLPATNDVVFFNTGTHDVEIAVGGSSTVGSAAAQFHIPGESWAQITRGSNSWFKAIGLGGTTSVLASGGVGQYRGAGGGAGVGGGSDTVTVASGNIGVSSLPPVTGSVTASPTGTTTVHVLGTDTVNVNVVAGGAGGGNVTIAGATATVPVNVVAGGAGGGNVTITGASATVPVSGSVTAVPSGTTTVTGTVAVSGSATVTPAAGTHTQIATAGTAVTVMSGYLNGGYVKNPNAATTILFIDMVNVAATVEGGTNRGLMPGELMTIPAGANATVTANSTDSVHSFVAVKW